MRSFLFALALAGTHMGVNAQAPLMRNMEMWKDKVAQQFDEDCGQDLTQQVQSKSSYQYLNANTKKFAVDSKDLPDVSFDIGESYAGLLPISDNAKDGELFFWFVPTTNPDAKDEITIWLNGGPGCSSLDGFFHENGPMTWMAGTYRPVINNYAWNNLTNIVWVEQPIGTGYTTGKPTARNEVDVADQFRGFWKNFADTFSLHNRKVYVTGESYAGMYVPYIADGMIQQKNKKYFDVNGIMIYDPSIGPSILTEEAPTLKFIERNPTSFFFNDTTMAELKKQSKECGYDDLVKTALTFPPNGHFHAPAEKRGCDIFDNVFRTVFDINPCFNIYLVDQICPILWDVEGFPYSRFYLPKGYKNPYFNHTAVKKVLHAPIDSDWTICGGPVFPHGDASPPSGANGGPLARVAEATNNVIVGHGLLDMVLIAEGSLMTLNNLTWNGKQGFSNPPNKDFYVPFHVDHSKSSQAGAGTFGQWVSERGLTFVEVDGSGHMIPEFQPSAGYRTLEVLLGRVPNLGSMAPFSTQKNVPQPHKRTVDVPRVR